MPSLPEVGIPVATLSHNDGALNENQQSFNRTECHQSNRDNQNNHHVSVNNYFHGRREYRWSSPALLDTQASPNGRREQDTTPRRRRFNTWERVALAMLIMAVVGAIIGVPVGLLTSPKPSKDMSEPNGNVSSIHHNSAGGMRSTLKAYLISIRL
jgi:hypothetical protein